MDTKDLKSTKSDPFFKNTKVQTCQFIQTVNGQPRAIAYPQKKTGYKAPNSWVNQRRSSETESHASQTHKLHPSMHAGMEKKPLVKYDPNSFRSRLPTVDYVIPYKNTSQIEIGDRSSLSTASQFKTSYQSNMTSHNMRDFTSNSGTIARMTKWHKSRVDS